MTATGGATVGRASGGPWMAARAATLLRVMIGLWIFSGFFVLIEPAPYELLFLAVLGLAIFAGFRVYPGTLPLLGMFVCFVPFALIAVFQVRYNDLDTTLIYTLVTVFLLLTSYFAANFVAQSPLRNVRLIGSAYIAAAVVSAAVGSLAYLGVIPGEELLLRFGRAKAFFKDPNVFGPFLVLPAMILLQRLLLGRERLPLRNAVLFLVLFTGIFLSFSRGAWGHFAASAAMVFVLCFFLEASGRDKVRMLLIAMAGLMAMSLALVALLSVEDVAALFADRFALTQSYDSGETGRFGRIGYAFDLALTHPLGLGPLEFGYLRISEQPHNTYVNVLHAYGWGGGMVYMVLVVWTLAKGAKALLRASPSRVLLIPVYGTFVPMILLSAIIDTDHWRHWFLVTGLVWGIVAAYDRRDAGAEGGLP
ncbi:O-antigen ligase family protein [Pelagibacterium montanilacus]|uniref:O-antigen ligase family protein n=1 Tax=Pelagibacterium montanilacus TaxID=2185280 RepID=UPI000F8CA4D5|nr:O-antigen ligase domain-containing protein [Pelagibacterium montanilacus]